MKSDVTTWRTFLCYVWRKYKKYLLLKKKKLPPGNCLQEHLGHSAEFLMSHKTTTTSEFFWELFFYRTEFAQIYLKCQNHRLTRIWKCREINIQDTWQVKNKNNHETGLNRSPSWSHGMNICYGICFPLQPSTLNLHNCIIQHLTEKGRKRKHRSCFKPRFLINSPLNWP